MPVNQALVVIIALVGLLGAPIVFIFYREQLDILDEMRRLFLKQKSGVSLLSPIEFLAVERVVRSGAGYLGTNGDVFNLMFPTRYWFVALGAVLHLAAFTALASFLWRIGSIQDKNETLSSLFTLASEIVPMSLVFFSTSFVIYVITVFISINQKQALRRRINDLAEQVTR